MYKCECHKDRYPYKQWSQISYPGELSLPVPIEPLAGTWPMYYMKRIAEGRFADQRGKPVTLEIRQPCAIDFDKELEYAKLAAENLTPRQILIAKYWGEGVATKQWTPIIDRLIDTYGIEAPRASRILAAVNAGMSDAFVVCWYLKYLWDVARPVQLDKRLKTVLSTPKHPSYPSGHATISGAAEVILSYFFRPEARRLKELAEENAMSRLYAGVHFPSDNVQGLRLGRQVGRLVVDVLKNEYDGSGKKVDIVICRNLRAKLPPPPYRQVIPFS